jgi:hypothetical protein
MVKPRKKSIDVTLSGTEGLIVCVSAFIFLNNWLSGSGSLKYMIFSSQRGK